MLLIATTLLAASSAADPPLRPFVGVAANGCFCLSAGDHYEDSLDGASAFGVRGDLGLHLARGVHMGARLGHEWFRDYARDASVLVAGGFVSARWGGRVRSGLTVAYGYARSDEGERVSPGRFFDSSYDLSVRVRDEHDRLEIFVETTILSGRTFTYPKPVTWGPSTPPKTGWGYLTVPFLTGGLAAGIRFAF